MFCWCEIDRGNKRKGCVCGGGSDRILKVWHRTGRKKSSGYSILWAASRIHIILVRYVYIYIYGSCRRDTPSDRVNFTWNRTQSSPSLSLVFPVDQNPPPSSSTSRVHHTITHNYLRKPHISIICHIPFPLPRLSQCHSMALQEELFFHSFFFNRALICVEYLLWKLFFFEWIFIKLVLLGRDLILIR